MAKLLVFISCSVLLALGVGKIDALEYRWDFNSGTSGFVNTGGVPWEWSGAVSPNTADFGFVIPDTYGNYMWIQDLATAPSTGSMVSTPATNVTIYPNDMICINIFRYLTVPSETATPVLKLVTNAGTHSQTVLWSYNTEVWDHVDVICGPMDDPCCQAYPCIGYLEVYAEIEAWGNLLVVDEIGVNGACRGPSVRETSN